MEDTKKSDLLFNLFNTGVYIRKDRLFKALQHLAVLKEFHKILSFNKTIISAKYQKKISERFFLEETSGAGTVYIKISRGSFFNRVMPLLMSDTSKVTVKLHNRLAKAFLLPDRGDVKKTKTLEYAAGQKPVVQYLCAKYFNPERISDGRACCTLVMDTGLGKSFVAMKLIELLGMKTLYVVKDVNLAEQFISDMKDYYPELKFGMYGGGKSVDGDVVMIIINSLINAIDAGEFNFKPKKRDVASLRGPVKAEEYISRFGLCIFDEIPEYASEARRKAFWYTNTHVSLGMTATPDERADGLDVVYHHHLGDLVYARDIPGCIVEDIKWSGEVKVIRYHGDEQYTKQIKRANGDTDATEMEKQLPKDPERNKIVLQEVKRLLELGTNVFIFARMRDHLSDLANSLAEAGIATEDIETLVGGVDQETKEKAGTVAKVICIGYQYGSVGLSIPRMNGIIFYTPRKSNMRQIIGRILRRSGDPTQKRYIVDIVDENTCFRAQYSKRKKIYLEKGFTIEDPR